MPLAATTYMLLVRPTPGSDDDVWDDAINTLIGLIDGHRHITGEGRQIPAAGINIDAAFQMNSNRVTEIAGLELDNLGAVLTTGAREVFVSGGNLYYRNNSGTNVRITSGATLDQTTVGGIAGDYSAVGAEVAFTDGTDTYTVKQQLAAGARQWGKVGHADLQLYEYLAAPDPTAPTNAVTLKSPAALGAAYAITFPAAVPGATAIVSMSATGVLTSSNTIANLITASLGLTAAVDQHIAVSGVGAFKHGAITLPIDVSAGIGNANATFGATGWAFTGAAQVDIPVTLPVGKRITAATFTFRRDSAGTLTFALGRRTSAGFAVLCQKDVAAGAGLLTTEIGTSPTSGSLPQTIAAGGTYALVVTGANLDDLISVEIVYDHP